MDKRTRATVEFLISHLRRKLAFDDAVALAFEERTGRELPRGGEYTAEDAGRANEILRACWDCDEATKS